MSRKKLSPAESAKHAKILKVASKMFMAQSYSTISMDALADAVPVSKRTLYNHFKDKKALFTAVMQARCAIVFEDFENTLSQGLGVEQTLTKIGKRFMSVVLVPASINIHRVMITESLLFPELGKLFYESGPKHSTHILGEYFKKIDERNELSIPNPELAADMFLGMLGNRLKMKCMLGIKKNVSQKEKDEIIHYAVRLFIAGHKPTQTKK